MTEPSSNWVRQSSGYYSSVFGEYTYEINPVTGERIIYFGTIIENLVPILSILSSGQITELSNFQSIKNKIGTSGILNLINESKSVAVDLMKSTGTASEETINSEEYKSSLINVDFLSLFQGGDESRVRPEPPQAQRTPTTRPTPGTGVGNIPRQEGTGRGSPTDSQVGGSFLNSTTILDDPRTNKNVKNISYTYPNNLGSNGQDYIKFDKFEYISKPINTRSRNLTEQTQISNNIVNPLGTVRLPIQPSITDSNNVNWGSGDMNPLAAYAAALSIQGQESLTEALRTATQDATKFIEATKIDPSYANALRVWLASEAVGINGLLPRVTGAIVNPNLELLFQGPQLRPFNFSFKLSPRSSEEAAQVRQIIRFFKQGMSVQKASSQIFLKTPDVFNITYMDGTDSKKEYHQSLNRIKTCALLSASVDYTPDGSYMTFNDNEHTMTSYQLTLSFSEIDPVYNDDYVNMANDVIGY